MFDDIIEWNKPLGNPPYCYRWVLNLGIIGFRIHRWVGSDIHEHTHPYWMLIFCIYGGYNDVGEVKDKVIAPAIRFRKHTHKHKVFTKKCLTFLITGPKIHRWHLFKQGKKYTPYKYFSKMENI